MSDSEMRSLTGLLSSNSKLEVAGWALEQYRYMEAVTCLCRDRPWSDKEFSDLGVAIGNSSEFYDIQERSIPLIGPAYRYDLVESTPASTQRFQLVRPLSDASCLLVQTNRTAESDPRRADFFSKLAPLNFGRPNSGANGTANRLRALESLRADGLITLEEYKARKKAILDAL